MDVSLKYPYNFPGYKPPLPFRTEEKKYANIDLEGGDTS
jgi:hypothetical protein